MGCIISVIHPGGNILSAQLNTVSTLTSWILMESHF